MVTSKEQAQKNVNLNIQSATTVLIGHIENAIKSLTKTTTFVIPVGDTPDEVLRHVIDTYRTHGWKVEIQLPGYDVREQMSVGTKKLLFS